MTTANIVFLIDIQNGFAKNNLTAEQGGCLYVPGGEKAGEPAANLMRNLSNATIVLSQDFHPLKHISFASNHPGAAPFSTLQLERDTGGAYAVAKAGERGDLQQTAWLVHCVQNTESALFVDPIMGELPDGLRQFLRNNVLNRAARTFDARDNEIFVVRKGMRPDLDSYGIAMENDGIQSTAAPAIFKRIAEEYPADVKEVNIYIGGLATNYCVEFSHKDINDLLVTKLKARGIKTNVYLLTDISAGIPATVEGGAWPDLDSAFKRMAAFGTKATTTDEVIRSTLKGPNNKPPSPQPSR